MDPVYVEDRLAGMGPLLVELEQHLPSHHHLGQVSHLDIGRIDGSHHLAETQDGYPVRQLHDLFELVGDQDDGQALVPHPAKDPEEFLDALRSENRRRLVQDQDLHAEVQGLEYLDPLLLSDGQPAHLGVRIDLDVIVAEELVEPAPHLRQIEPLAGRCTDDHVLDHRHRRNQLEVLVHHADTGRNGVAGRMELQSLAVEGHSPLIGPVNAVEDVGERGLAGAVLSQHAVDLASPDVYRDGVVGDHPGEALGNAIHGQDRLSHRVRFPEVWDLFE